jgi:phosphodiesterase/alkaline phosphatase D-like protein
LRWTDNSNIEEGFELMRSTDGVSFSRVARLNANTAYFANSGLTAGKKYWYRVRAYNLGGKSGYSNTLSASTFF